MAAAKQLFVDGRKAAAAAAAMGDRARDVAEAGIAAAAAAARTGTSPISPGRVDKELEAVYNAALTVRMAMFGGRNGRGVY